jgi:aspartate racemase
MACNTAHAAPIFNVILEQLQVRRIDIQLLHLVNETIEHLRRDHAAIGKVGVLSTRGAYRSRLYEQALEDAGVETILPDPDIRDEIVHAAIYARGFGIKATAGAVSAQARELVHAAIAQVGERGAEAVILGCTELALAIAEPFVEGIPVLDPARIIATRITRILRPGQST